jgi:hypothetical protein
MPDAPVDSLREVRCGRCALVFYVCRRCDRGQIYCDDPCRDAARRDDKREAQRRYRAHPLVRADHRDYMRARRAAAQVQVGFVRDHRIRRRSPIQSRRGAEQHERVLRDELVRSEEMYGEPYFGPPISFARFLEHWLEVRAKPLNRPSTYIRKCQVARRNLVPEFGTLPLHAVGDGRIEAFAGRLATRGMKPRLADVLAHGYAAHAHLLGDRPLASSFHKDLVTNNVDLIHPEHPSSRLGRSPEQLLLTGTGCPGWITFERCGGSVS